MKTKTILLSLFTTSLFFTACKKDEVTTPTTSQSFSLLVKDLDADADQPYKNQFTYYSFKDQKVITGSDTASNKWDIAFKGTTIIINGGPIRNGNGGAYIFEGSYSELLNIPETAQFRVDSSATSLAIPTGSGNGWYNYNPQAFVISPIPGRTLVIKTGDGKYAKMEVISYYKNAPVAPTQADPARYYTFRYFYQADGSKKMQ